MATSRLLSFGPRTLGLLTLVSLPIPLNGQNTVQAWGWDVEGQVSNTPSEGGFVQVASGDVHSVGLRADGTLVGWGSDWHGISTPPSGNDFTKIEAGFNFSLALRSDGSIEAWGADFFNSVSDAPGGTGFIDIAAAPYAGAALRADGSIVAWGQDDLSFVTGIPVETGFTAIAAGPRGGLAMRNDGSIVSWGGTATLQGIPTEGGFTQMDVGDSSCLALRADGSIYSWGSDLHKTIQGTPTATGFTHITAAAYAFAAIRGNGKVVMWGTPVGETYNNDHTNDAPKGKGFTGISGGFRNFLVLRAENEGTAFCFGDGSGATCPCGAFGSNRIGCANSSGDGARLLVTGGAYIAGDVLDFQVTGVPGAKPGLLLRGNDQVNGGLGNPIGDGLLCVGGNTSRSDVFVTSVGGAVSITEFQGEPFGRLSTGPGTTERFQFWYRDSANTCSGAGFNFSNGWELTWLP